MTEASAQILTLFDAFPVAVCDCSARPATISAHLASTEIAAAPQRARAAAAALRAAAEAGDEAALEEALATLHGGLRARAAQPGLPPPSLEQLKLLRMFFVSVVLLLDASLGPGSRPHGIASRHAAAALHGLACLALGAVAIPQLEPLEAKILLTLGSEGALLPSILETLHAPSVPTAAALRDSEAAVRVTDALGARRALALRWASNALSMPQLAPQLWPVLPLLMDLSTCLLNPEGGAYPIVCASVMHAALGGLLVEEPEQLGMAHRVLECVRARCAELLLDAASASAVDGGAGLELSASAERVDALCALLFDLLPDLKEPLLPALLDAARSLVLTAAPRADALCTACCARLRDVVSAVPAGVERKQALVDWLFALRSEVMQVEEAEARRRSAAAC